MEKILEENDWLTLTKFFPKGWDEKAHELGLIQRKRKIKSPSDLLRLLLIHLADNCSLKETSVRGKIGGIADISAVALMKKMKLASEWFRWMTNEMIIKRGISLITPIQFSRYNIKSVDASVISEPGSTGTDWRLHYCMNLFDLKCNQFIISKQDKGESFTNFIVNKNDLFIGDRAYGRYKGMKYIRDSQGHFLTRYVNKAFTLFTKKTERIKLLDYIRPLQTGEIFELKAYIGEKKLPIRVIAVKKSEKQAELSFKKVKRVHKRKQKKINLETLEYHRYIILITSLPKNIPAERVLELYRLRWQIEIAFKHLKSIFGLGHLPKEDEESCKAWLHGKFFVALLAQTIRDEARIFSPWGYPI